MQEELHQPDTQTPSTDPGRLTPVRSLHEWLHRTKLSLAFGVRDGRYHILQFPRHISQIPSPPLLLLLLRSISSSTFRIVHSNVSIQTGLFIKPPPTSSPRYRAIFNLITPSHHQPPPSFSCQTRHPPHLGKLLVPPTSHLCLASDCSASFPSRQGSSVYSLPFNSL